MGIFKAIKSSIGSQFKGLGKDFGKFWSKNFTYDLPNTATKWIGHMVGNITGRNEAMAFAKSQDEYSRYLEQNAAQIRAEDMRKAGFHPTAGMGSPSVVNPAGHAPSGDRMSPMDMALAFSQLGIAGAEKARLKAEARNIDADTDLKRQQELADLPNLTAQEIMRRLENGELSISFLDKKLEELQANIDLTKAQTSTDIEQTRQLEEYFKLEYARQEYNLKKLKDSHMHESQLASDISQIITILKSLKESYDSGKLKELKDNVENAFKKSKTEEEKGVFSPQAFLETLGKLFNLF